MNRRDFIASVMAAATTQVAMAEEPTKRAQGQQPVKSFRIGYLTWGTTDERVPQLFAKALQEIGWIEEKNMRSCIGALATVPRRCQC